MVTRETTSVSKKATCFWSGQMGSNLPLEEDFIYIYIYMCVCIYIYVCVCVYIYMCIYICIHIYMTKLFM